MWKILFLNRCFLQNQFLTNFEEVIAKNRFSSFSTFWNNCPYLIIQSSTPFIKWLQMPLCFILYWSSRSFLIWLQIPFTVNHYSCYMCLLIQIYLSGSSFDSAENDKRVLPRSPSPPLRVGLLRSSPSHDSPVSINKSAPI